ncbi:hypothetical protein DSUL_20078 [Desulfovibrionales bacterium]
MIVLHDLHLEYAAKYTQHILTTEPLFLSIQEKRTYYDSSTCTTSTSRHKCTTTLCPDLLRR